MMFKKSEPEVIQSRSDHTAAATATTEPQQSRTQATIGATIHIKGDVTGDENLTVEGTVEGTVTVKQHSLQVGKNGRLTADIYARVIKVDGQVVGNLFADEQVVIRQSGVVRGNITAPRLAMEDGCTFKGSIDMEGRQSDRQRQNDRKGASDSTTPPGSDSDTATAAKPAAVNGSGGNSAPGTRPA